MRHAAQLSLLTNPCIALFLHFIMLHVKRLMLIAARAYLRNMIDAKDVGRVIVRRFSLIKRETNLRAAWPHAVAGSVGDIFRVNPLMMAAIIFACLSLIYRQNSHLQNASSSNRSKVLLSSWEPCYHIIKPPHLYPIKVDSDRNDCHVHLFQLFSVEVF